MGYQRALSGFRVGDQRAETGFRIEQHRAHRGFTSRIGYHRFHRGAKFGNKSGFRVAYQWTGLEFAKSQRAVENREKWRKLVAKSSVVPQRPSRLRDR